MSGWIQSHVFIKRQPSAGTSALWSHKALISSPCSPLFKRLHYLLCLIPSFDWTAGDGGAVAPRLVTAASLAPLIRKCQPPTSCHLFPSHPPSPDVCSVCVALVHGAQLKKLIYFFKPQLTRQSLLSVLFRPAHDHDPQVIKPRPLLMLIVFLSVAGIPRPPHPSDISPYYPLSPGAVGQIPHPLGWLVPQ